MRTSLQPTLCHRLCLHKPGSVVSKSMSPPINTFLENQYTNRPFIGLQKRLSASVSPWFYLSPPEIRPFSLPVKLMAVIFSGAVSDTLFTRLSLSRFLLSPSLWFQYHALFTFLGQGTQPLTSSMNTTALVAFVAVNICWASPFRPWLGDQYLLPIYIQYRYLIWTLFVCFQTGRLKNGLQICFKHTKQRMTQVPPEIAQHP